MSNVIQGSQQYGERPQAFSLQCIAETRHAGRRRAAFLFLALLLFAVVSTDCAGRANGLAKIDNGRSLLSEGDWCAAFDSFLSVTRDFYGTTWEDSALLDLKRCLFNVSFDTAYRYLVADDSSDALPRLMLALSDIGVFLHSRWLWAEEYAEWDDALRLGTGLALGILEPEEVSLPDAVWFKSLNKNPRGQRRGADIRFADLESLKEHEWQSYRDKWVSNRLWAKQPVDSVRQHSVR